MKTLLKTFFFSILSLSQINAQKEILGYWSGNLKMLSMELNFQIKVSKTNKSLEGFINIPSQKVSEYKLPVFTYKKNQIHFELPGSAGVAKFDGKLKADSIKGTLLQAGIKGIFNLVKIDQPVKEEKVEIQKKEPLPYSEEDIAFKSGRILLAGTLTTPKTEGIYPAVILLTGNGPQDRDEDVFGFKIFQIIADYLTKNGVAVLRYDDRGVGGSTGNTMQSTTEDFSNDALAAIEFLKKQKNIDKTKIGLLGHSEGSQIAELAAVNSKDVSFIVLLSGNGVDGGKALIEQQKLILKVNGVADSLITQNLELQNKINYALSNDIDLNDIRKDIRAFAEKDFAGLNKEVRNSIQNKETYLNSNVQSQIQIFNNPWFRYYVKYDPIPTLERIKIPVLMLFGELDLQFPPSLNKQRMEEALVKAGNKNFKSIVFPKVNHLYQEAKIGSPSEYSELKKEFAPGFLETIGNWVLNVIK
ncbi:MAG: alpha/beta fold hydrolase [Ignavibacteriales bacterium]|nr:MAG: alpha/beta fold hydrolase [Ignavibacteriales bacterium]